MDPASVFENASGVEAEKALTPENPESSPETLPESQRKDIESIVDAVNAASSAMDMLQIAAASESTTEKAISKAPETEVSDFIVVSFSNDIDSERKVKKTATFEICSENSQVPSAGDPQETPKKTVNSEEIEKSSVPAVTGPLEKVTNTENSCESAPPKISGMKSIASAANLGSMDVSPKGSDDKSNGHHVNEEKGATNSMVEEAWEYLTKSTVNFNGKPVGTLAALDPTAEALNYNQVFVRDFFPCGLAFLMKNPPEPEIVKNFLLKTIHLQSREKTIDNFTLGQGVMPASFKVSEDPLRKAQVLTPDFGGTAIGRVAPVDSGFWWIILLRCYTKCTGDFALSQLPEVQTGMKLILHLCLSDGFDTFPTLLCADGCSMIDRRMGIYGYPIEIQALFYFALRCARALLKTEKDGKELMESIEKRISALSFHIRNYYWLDFTQLNNIYRYKTEEYSRTAVNKFNVNPISIPDWLFGFMPSKGGYLIGNVSPARMDFRWFLVGNCMAILSCLVKQEQADAIMDLIEERWTELVGEMPLKAAYPALDENEWKIVTGCDPKNTSWSYHNGGSWPVLLWLLTAASIKLHRPQIARRALELIEQRLSKDGWPEYYDGKTGRYIGKQARKYQTWSIGGYLVSKMLLDDPSKIVMISLDEDKKIAKPRLTRSASWASSNTTSFALNL